MLFKDNLEKYMVFLFPLITFSLFVVAVVLLWVVAANPFHWW